MKRDGLALSYISRRPSAAPPRVSDGETERRTSLLPKCKKNSERGECARCRHSHAHSPARTWLPLDSLKTLCPFNSNITPLPRLPLLGGGSSSGSPPPPPFLPVLHSLPFSVMEAGARLAALKKLFLRISSPGAWWTLAHLFVIFSPPPALLQPARQTITSSTCTICNVIATNILPAKILMKKKKKKKNLGGWLLQPHSGSDT